MDCKRSVCGRWRRGGDETIVPDSGFTVVCRLLYKVACLLPSFLQLRPGKKNSSRGENKKMAAVAVEIIYLTRRVKVAYHVISFSSRLPPPTPPPLQQNFIRFLYSKYSSICKQTHSHFLSRKVFNKIIY